MIASKRGMCLALFATMRIRFFHMTLVAILIGTAAQPSPAEAKFDFMRRKLSTENALVPADQAGADAPFEEPPDQMRREAIDAYYHRGGNMPFFKEVGVASAGFMAGMGFVAAALHGTDPDFFQKLVMNSILDPTAFATALAYVGGDRATVALLIQMRLLYDFRGEALTLNDLGALARGKRPGGRPPNEAWTRAASAPPSASKEVSTNLDWEVRQLVQSRPPSAVQMKFARLLPALRMFGGIMAGSVVGELLHDKDLVACAEGYGTNLNFKQFNEWNQSCKKAKQNWLSSQRLRHMGVVAFAQLPIVAFVTRKQLTGRALWNAEMVYPNVPGGIQLYERAAPALAEGEKLLSMRGLRFALGRARLGLEFVGRSAFVPGLIMAAGEVIGDWLEQPLDTGTVGIDSGNAWNNIEARWKWHESTGWAVDTPPGCGADSASLPPRTSSQTPGDYAYLVRQAVAACGSSSDGLLDMLDQAPAKGAAWRQGLLAEAMKSYSSWKNYVSDFQSSYVASYMVMRGLVQQVNDHETAIARGGQLPALYRGLSAYDAGIPTMDLAKFAFNVRMPGLLELPDRQSQIVIEQAVNYIQTVLHYHASGSYQLTATDERRLNEILEGLMAGLEPRNNVEEPGAWSPSAKVAPPIHSKGTSGETRAMLDNEQRARRVQHAIDLVYSALEAARTSPTMRGDHPYALLRDILRNNEPLPVGVAMLMRLNGAIEGNSILHPNVYGGALATPTMADYALVAGICGPDATPAGLTEEGRIQAQAPGDQWFPTWGANQTVQMRYQWGVSWRQPRLISGSVDAFCRGRPTEARASVPGAKTIDIHRSKWTVDGVVYEGLLDVFRKLVRRDVIGAPGTGYSAFREWWISNVDPAVAFRLEDMRARYDEIARNEVLPGLFGNPPANTSWYWKPFYSLRSFVPLAVSRGVSGHELSNNYIGSITQDFGRWTRLTKRAIAPGLPDQIPGLEIEGGKKTVPQALIEQLNLAERDMNLAIGILRGGSELRTAVIEFELQAARYARDDADELRKKAAASGEPTSALADELEKHAFVSDADWADLINQRAPSQYRVRTAFLGLVGQATRNLQRASVVLGIVAAHARDVMKDPALTNRATVGSATAVNARAVTDEFLKIFDITNVIKGDVLGVE